MVTNSTKKSLIKLHYHAIYYMTNQNFNPTSLEIRDIPTGWDCPFETEGTVARFCETVAVFWDWATSACIFTWKKMLKTKR